MKYYKALFDISFFKTFKCNNFIKVLVVFVQKNDSIDKRNCKIYHLKKVFFWMNKSTICIYDALLSWKTNNKINNNINEMIQE